MISHPKKNGYGHDDHNLGDEWIEAIDSALAKPKPVEGWPKPEAVPQRAPLNPKKGPRPKKKTPK